MFYLFQQFGAICFFKSGPSDLPYSIMALKFVFVINIIGSILLSYQEGVMLSLVLALLSLALLFALVDGTLFLTMKRPRFVQTITAILGTEIIFILILLVFQIVLALINGEILKSIIADMIIFVQLWSIIVQSRILQLAAEILFIQAILLTFLYIITFFFILFLIYPESGI